MSTAFEIVTPKTADQIYARLTEAERIKLRHATTPERVQFLAESDYASDGATFEAMVEVKDRCDAAFAAYDQTDLTTIPSTWKF